MISAVALTRRFGARTAVDRLTLTVARSEIVALLGPNGAGKTTALRMLAGLLTPTAGTVTIDNVELTQRTAGTLHRRIGFLTENPGLWDRLTVHENLRVYAELYGLDDSMRVIDRTLEALGLRERGSTRTAELSRGMRQKVALARALLHDPGILLLDEPTSGLDPEIARSVRALLDERRARGCAILLSTHNLDEAERLADRIAVLDGKLLACDRPSALRRKLMTGRLAIRVAGEAVRFIDIARAVDQRAFVDGSTLVVTFARPEAETPILVRALVSEGADILEVRSEMPALEDVYLHLVGREASAPEEPR